jgi:glucosamine--fructose-6-phosphate aminotransferase (isomerizing)
MWRNFYRVTNAYSPLRVPPYLEDIRQQPAAVAQLLDSGMSEECRHLLGRAQKYDRIVMTGMGASLFGMYPGFLRLASAGLAVWEVETAELLGPANGLITPNTLLWLTSQSGSSAEIQALLDRLPHRPAATLGVTNDPLSPLGTHADVVLELQSGPEHTVGTRSYVNTLVATAMAVATVLGQPFDPELSRVPDRLSAYLGGWDEHVQKLDQSVPESTIFVLGRGASLAAARTGSLVIKEASGRPVEGMSVPQFRHGPLEMAGPGVTVLLLAGRPEDRTVNRTMLDDLRAAGARAVWCQPAGGADDIGAPRLDSIDTRAIAEILPLQLLSVVLAERDGHEPGAFRRIGKVTTTL